MLADIFLQEPQTPARNLTTEFDSKAKRPPVDRQHVRTTLKMISPIYPFICY